MSKRRIGRRSGAAQLGLSGSSWLYSGYMHTERIEVDVGIVFTGEDVTGGQINAAAPAAAFDRRAGALMSTAGLKKKRNRQNR